MGEHGNKGSNERDPVTHLSLIHILLTARLSRCYNVDIQIASKELETMQFTGIIFRNKPLDFALDIIPVSYTHLDVYKRQTPYYMDMEVLL